MPGLDPDKTWVWRLKSPGYTVRANGAGEAVKVSVGQHPNKLIPMLRSGMTSGSG